MRTLPSRFQGELVFPGQGGRNLTRNECKHSFASNLVMRGVPLKAVHELLGHATIEMTMRYAHLSPDVRRNAVQLLDGYSQAELPRAVG